jgi:hypothetical protein
MVNPWRRWDKTSVDRNVTSETITVRLRTACQCERIVTCAYPETEAALAYVSVTFRADPAFCDDPGPHRMGIRRFRREGDIAGEPTPGFPVYREIVGDSWAEDRYNHFCDLSKIYGVDVGL